MQSHRAAFQDLPSRVVAAVPQAQLLEVPWAAGTNTDPRRHAKFVSYALLAAAEALQVGWWVPLLGDTSGPAACLPYRLLWACIQLPSDVPQPLQAYDIRNCLSTVMLVPQVNMLWAETPPDCCSWIAEPCSCKMCERSVRHLLCQACVAVHSAGM